MDAAIINAIERYVVAARNQADVSKCNPYVDYGDQTFDLLFDCPVCYWFACLLVSLTDVTELTST
jgi:hypothetical protein